MKKDKCKKCGRGFKLLTDKGLCAYDDYLGWRKKYFSVPAKLRK